MTATIRTASASDIDGILALLTTVDLPHVGVVEHAGSFVVACDEDNRLVGCAGLERYGALALLRSVVVLPDRQGTGLGSKLTAALLDGAARSGVEEVVLLTTTARDFFAWRFGFTEAARTDYSEQLAGSAEWLLPRCSSAVCMRLRLK